MRYCISFYLYTVYAKLEHSKALLFLYVGVKFSFSHDPDPDRMCSDSTIHSDAIEHINKSRHCTTNIPCSVRSRFDLFVKTLLLPRKFVTSVSQHVARYSSETVGFMHTCPHVHRASLVQVRGSSLFCSVLPPQTGRRKPCSSKEESQRIHPQETHGHDFG